MIETINIWYRIRLIGLRCLFIAFALASLSTSAHAQPGCMDPRADNYDPNATSSDGSCIYPETNLSADVLAILPDALEECSGFVELPEYYLAMNDSGSAPELIYLSKDDFSVIRTEPVQGAMNVDWEEITIDENFLYIGDFGNNNGTRQNLKIYKVPLSSLATSPFVQDTLNFKYEDQVSFSTTIFSTPYDCEAFVVNGDQIHLFTKGWSNQYCRQYILQNDVSDQEAVLKDSFYVGGLITGADLLADSVLMLTGYNNLSIAWMLKDFEGTDYFNGNKRAFQLGNLGQNETITWIGEADLIITSEAGILGTQTAYQINIEEFITGINNRRESPLLSIFPNPFMETLQIEWSGAPSEIYIYDTFGQLIYQSDSALNMIDGSDWPSGAYTIRIFSKGKFSNQSYGIIKQ